MLLGAHVSTAGGVDQAPSRAAEIGCESFQIFTRNQRQWHPKALEVQEIKRFKKECEQAGYTHSWIAHASYLINLASDNADLVEKSVNALADEATRCQQLGRGAVCFHPGSHLGLGEERGLELVIKNLKRVLELTAGSRTKILLENTAGQGSNLGYRLEHLAAIRRGVRSRRVAFCLDTCHLFAAGYDLKSARAYERTLAEVDELLGFKNVVAFHLNDSVHPLGSRKDRHAGIGQGALGRAPFGRLVSEPSFGETIAVLETPGGPPAYESELKTLKKLRKFA